MTNARFKKFMWDFIEYQKEEVIEWHDKNILRRGDLDEKKG